MALNQQNAHNCSSNMYMIISHWIFLHALIHKGPSSANHMKAIPHKTKLATLYTVDMVKKSREKLECRHFFVEQLYKCAEFW